MLKSVCLGSSASLLDSMEEYIKRFHPDYVLGVSDDKLKSRDYTIQEIQLFFNNYIKEKINYKHYLDHV